VSRIYWKRFGKELRVCREAFDEGLREFSKRTKIDKAAVSRAENGKPVTVENFFSLCQAWQLDPWSYVDQKR
jgi:transcriptional regulator with XRE-family HTH domain